MGFSASAVVVILTASVMYTATIFYPLVDMSYQQFKEANIDSNELWNEKLNTRIMITNWAGSSMTIFNNGSMTLNSSKINIILNGELRSSSQYTVNPQGVWPPKTSINVDIGTGTGRVKIITENGAADYSIT